MDLEDVTSWTRSGNRGAEQVCLSGASRWLVEEQRPEGQLAALSAMPRPPTIPLLQMPPANQIGIPQTRSVFWTASGCWEQS